MDLIGYLILLTVCFFAAIIGTMMGMAMIIVIPVMVSLGVPIHTAIATGRFSMLGINMGNIVSFSRQKTMRREYILSFAVAGAIGAFAGASSLSLISEEALRIIVGVCMILISIIIFFEEKIRQFHPGKNEITFKHHSLSALAGLFIGSYIGVIGGGGATLVIFVLVLLYGLNFHQALANQKAITLPISLIATLVFIVQGMIDYRLAIPMLIANLFGGMIGVRVVMKMKGHWLRNILVPVTIVLGLMLIFF